MFLFFGRRLVSDFRIRGCKGGERLMFDVSRHSTVCARAGVGRGDDIGVIGVKVGVMN